MNQVNIIVIGGSGHLCELNHYPAIRSLAKEGISARVVIICDPIDPRSTSESSYKVGRQHLRAILESDDPQWVDPTKYTETGLKKYLNKIAKEQGITIAIIATSPSYHYFYADWAVNAGISVLCDKPLVAVPDASWNLEKARIIEQSFQSLCKKVDNAQKLNPDYRFCTPLRRRALTSFLTIANSLQDIHDKTNEGVTYMNAIVNGGIHRYPVEFLKGGAHGYLDGIGSLSHSSYHYLDLIAWFLQSAPGKIAKIKMSVPYVSRVSDYLSKQGYGQLLELNTEEKSVVAPEQLALPMSVLNAELDFTIHLQLLDELNNSIGLISYSCNHTTYTPRTTKYDPEMLDHANDEQGGRMSHVYFDIHQGSVQNWVLAKNDVVFHGNEITVTRRLHPSLGESYYQKVYTDAYESDTVTMKDLFTSFVKITAGMNVPEKHDVHLQRLSTQKLTHRIFSASYELIAQNYLDPTNPTITINFNELYGRTKHNQ